MPAAAAMPARPRQTRIEPGQVDHVNAHAVEHTGIGDAAEAAVLRLVLGEDAVRIPVTSTKSLTNYMPTSKPPACVRKSWFV